MTDDEMERAWQKVMAAERKCEEEERKLDGFLSGECDSHSDNMSGAPTCMYTEKERKAAIKANEKAVDRLFKSIFVVIVSVFAIIGAAIVSIFKKSWNPLYKTWDWCKDNVWPVMSE